MCLARRPADYAVKPTAGRVKIADVSAPYGIGASNHAKTLLLKSASEKIDSWKYG